MRDTFIIDSIGLEAEDLNIILSKTVWYDMLRFVNEEMSEAYADENLPADYKDYDDNAKGETK